MMEERALTSFQTLCEELLENIFNNHDESELLTFAFKATIKDLIRHYPEYTNEGQPTWKRYHTYTKYFRFTKKGWKAYKMDPLKVHYEHIWPVESTFRELIESRKRSGTLSKSSIHSILSRTEILILSKEEGTLLDGSPNLEYQIEGEFRKGTGLKKAGSLSERLEAIGAEIEPETSNNHISNP